MKRECDYCETEHDERWMTCRMLGRGKNEWICEKCRDKATRKRTVNFLSKKIEKEGR